MQIPKVIFEGLGYPKGFTDEIVADMQKAFDGKITEVEIDGRNTDKYYWVMVRLQGLTEGDYFEFDRIEVFADEHNWMRKYIELRRDKTGYMQTLAITFEVWPKTAK